MNRRERIALRLRRFVEIAKDVRYGIFLHEHVMANRKSARRIEQLLFLVTMGDIVGIPIILRATRCGSWPTTRSTSSAGRCS